jgi:hypothetical protein
MNRTIVVRLSVAVLSAVTVACGLSSPTRPTPPTPVSGDAGNGTTLKVSAPDPQSPANGATLSGITVSGIALSAGGASTVFASSASLQYEFELMGPGGSVIERSGPMDSPSWTQTSTLEFVTRYTWRVRAVQDDAVGPWSTTFSFVTPELPPEFRCRPPFMSGALAIMHCHLDVLDGRFHLGDERVLWLKRVARDFNVAGIPGGPFGVLWKRSGNNCGGYSCDIICSGQGNRQVQYDILVDDEIPVWSGGGNSGGQIRQDFCEIQ